MRVAVTGATGLIGSALVRELGARGDEVRALTRSPRAAAAVLGAGVQLHRWSDPVTEPPPPGALEGADAVVHLLGEPVAQRWSTAAKRAIRDSRVQSTAMLVRALAELGAESRPATLVSQSATGYYGPHGDEELDESAPPGEDFLAVLTREWEEAAHGAARIGTVRLAIARTGVVLAAEGGALTRMLTPFRLGLGGPVAGGGQYVPWVHLADVTGALLRLIDEPDAHGPFNVTAPNPASNAELSHALGRVLGRPAVLPVPAAALRLLYGEMASIVIDGARVVPAKLLDLGFGFAFPQLEPALREVLGRT
ncbi:MAG: TIGR01777 family oxidoreductase [Acidobacteriota bacterium]|nr:TIGR01777 family oxidoreductase [Acidobacteriota bacterium]